MSKKNLRRLSVLVTAQTMGNLEKLAAMEGYGNVGRVKMCIRDSSTTSSIRLPMLILTGRLLGSGLAWSVRRPPPWM